MHKLAHNFEKNTTEHVTSDPCVGQISGVNLQGELLVSYGGRGPFPARMLSGISRKELSHPNQRGREVLLIFLKGNPEKPVIVGCMSDPLDEILSLEIAGDPSDKPVDIQIDGRQIMIEAEDEIFLKCGKGSIQIRRDGKIIIKGTDLISRSSGPQRIRGASVNIN